MRSSHSFLMLLLGVACVGAAWLISLPVKAAQAGLGEKVVVVISNTDYTQTDDVAYAERDAQAFAQFAREVWQAQVYPYKDLGTNQMGELIGLNGEVGSLVNHINAPNTDLYIYYSGHGTHDVSPDPSQTKNYLLPVDANPDQAFLARQAYALDDIQRSLRQLQSQRMPQGRITLILEACFSGLSPSANGQNSSGLVRGVSAPPIGKAQDLSSDGIRLWTATSPDTRYAVWDTEFERGIFTDALLSGLHGGRADNNGDFTVTAAEMESYVRSTISRRISRIAQNEAAFVQAPSFVGNQTDEVVAAYPGQAYPVYATDAERGIMEDLRARLLLDAIEDPQVSLQVKQGHAQELRSYLTSCEQCPQEEAIRTQLSALTQELSACSAEQSLIGRFIEAGQSDRLERMQRLLRCQGMAPQLALCLQGGDLQAQSCQCLRSGDCQGQTAPPEPGPDVATGEDGPNCQQALQQATQQAETQANVQPLLTFASENPGCDDVSAQQSKALGQVCDTLALKAGVGQNRASRKRLEDFVRDQGACDVQVSRAEAQLAELDNRACARPFEAAKASDDPGALLRFTQDHSQCLAEISQAFSLIIERQQAVQQRSEVCRNTYAKAQTLFDYRAFLASFGDCTEQVALARDQVRWLEKQEAQAQECRDYYARARGLSGLKAFVVNFPHCEQQVQQAQRLIAESQHPFDGTYSGARGYTDSNRPSKSNWCLSRYNFSMTVQDGEASFYSDGRHWRGRVARDGTIQIDTNGVSPRPKNPISISGHISNARLWSGYCGSGYFRTTRQ